MASQGLQDLLLGLQTFNSGLKSLQTSRVLSNANEAVEQIRASDADAQAKKTQIRGIAEQLSMKLIGLGGSVDEAAKVAQIFEGPKSNLGNINNPLELITQGALLGDKTMLDAGKTLFEYQESFKADRQQAGLDAAADRQDKALAAKKAESVKSFKTNATKAITSSKDFKNLQELNQRVGGIEEFEKNPSAFGDISAIFGFMKSIDPESVVRESEYATAKNAGSLLTSARNWIDSKVSGDQLQPEQRADLVRLAKHMQSVFRRNYETYVDPFRRQAVERDVPLEDIDPFFNLGSRMEGSKTRNPDLESTPSAPAAPAPSAPKATRSWAKPRQ